jgi:L-iditol 2-dehydrogenase
MPRAAVMTAPHAPVSVQMLPDAPMEPGSVLLETLFSEICGTDVHLLHGRLAGVPYPIIPGHVSVGRVADIAGDVKYTSGQPVQTGDTVTFLDVHESCNHCWYCLVAKTSTRCPDRKVYGITYSAADGLLGGWSEQIYLKPGVKIIPLPESVPAERFIAAGCALPTALHALDRAGVRLGDSVAVQGCGPVGLNVALLAMLSGAGQVIVLDQNEQRLKIAKQMNVDTAICIPDAAEDDSHIQQVRAATDGRGVDVTVEATGVPAAIPQGMQMTRVGGRYVVVGHYTDGGTVAINPHEDINRKHLDVRGCWGSDYSHFHRAVGIIERFNNRVAGGGWEQLITGRYGLDQLNDALLEVAAGRTVKALVDPTA